MFALLAQLVGEPRVFVGKAAVVLGVVALELIPVDFPTWEFVDPSLDVLCFANSIPLHARKHIRLLQEYYRWNGSG